MTKTGLLIKRFRIEDCYPQKTVAEIIGVPLATYRSWEYGKCLPNYKNIEKLLEHYSENEDIENLYQAWVEERGGKIDNI